MSIVHLFAIVVQPIVAVVCVEPVMGSHCILTLSRSYRDLIMIFHCPYNMYTKAASFAKIFSHKIFEKDLRRFCLDKKWTRCGRVYAINKRRLKKKLTIRMRIVDQYAYDHFKKILTPRIAVQVFCLSDYFSKKTSRNLH